MANIMQTTLRELSGKKNISYADVCFSMSLRDEFIRVCAGNCLTPDGGRLFPEAKRNLLTQVYISRQTSVCLSVVRGN